MERSPQETLALFGSLGEDHGYSRLVDLFTEDAICYDPFFARRANGRGNDFFDTVTAWNLSEIAPTEGAQ
jgi:hypothetical protein